MKTLLCMLILVPGVIFYKPAVSGQMILSDYDSVAVTKPEISIPVYKFFYNREYEIQYGQIKSETVNYKSNPILKDIGNGILTAVTGIGFSTTTDINWKVTGTVGSNDLHPDWTVNLFCEGKYEKNRERVTNDDGSRSVETEEIAFFYWDKNANGILIESNDTIGIFSIIMNPCEIKLLELWCADVFPENQSGGKKTSKIKLDVFWRPSPGNDYGIIGKLRDRDFILLRNGNNRKIWIITESIPRSVFQSDLDYPGISRKYRIQPYFLIDPDISDQERNDIFRLAMVSKILNNSFDNSD